MVTFTEEILNGKFLCAVDFNVFQRTLFRGCFQICDMR